MEIVGSYYIVLYGRWVIQECENTATTEDLEYKKFEYVNVDNDNKRVEAYFDEPLSNFLSSGASIIL